MRFSSQFKKAGNNLLIAKLRTFLAMLGIIVGTASIVALLSAGALATQTALATFKKLGVNLMSITIIQKSQNAQTLPPITLKDLINLPNEVIEIDEMAPYMTNFVPASFGVQSWNGASIGATQSLANVINIKIDSGRFISDLDKRQYFCVIGQNVLKKMRILNPIGKRIKVGTVIFTVIGVAAPWPENGFFTANINDQVIFPIEVMSLLVKDATISAIILRLKPDINIDKVKEKIDAYFAKNLPDYEISNQSAKELIKNMEEQQEIYTLLLGFIGSISLIVGGIGVINIMLASVAERKYEIGLRLAVGAQPKDIQLMFLMEAIVLGVVGSGIGVILGILITAAIALGSGWIFTILPYPPLIGFSASVLITVIFGFYPALVASKVNPIDALRGL